jgi:YHS domain-containing protein
MSIHLGRRRILGILIALFAAIVTALPATAADLVNTTDNNVAIRGYDPVAYFTEGRPIEGRARYEYVWHDATWRFSSAEHRDLFADEPQRYAPRYGGFCAGAMARGRKAPIDPEAWVIINDRLYLNYAKGSVDDFARDADAQIANADAHWERLTSGN